MLLILISSFFSKIFFHLGVYFIKDNKDIINKTPLLQSLQGRSCKVEFQGRKNPNLFSKDSVRLLWSCEGRGVWGLYKARSGFWWRNVQENKSVSGTEPLLSKGLLTEWVRKETLLWSSCVLSVSLDMCIRISIPPTVSTSRHLDAKRNEYSNSWVFLPFC